MNPDLAQRFVDQHTNLLEAKEKFEACQSQTAHSPAPSNSPQQQAPPNNSQAQNTIPNNNVKTVTFQEPPNTSQQN